MKCILCHSENTHLLETIPKTSLNHLYHKSLRIDTSNLITNDLKYLHCKDCDLRFFTDTQDRVPTGDDAFYNSLNHLEWYYFSHKHEYDYVRDFIAQDSHFQNPRILEVGCGKAAFAKYLPENAQYVGLELSTQAKQMAQSQGIYIENITIEEFAKTHQDEFDISCSFQVLEHVSNPYEFLRAQIACLKSDNRGGGQKLLIIAVPSEESFLKHCTNGILNMPPHHVSRFSDKALQSIAHIFSIKLKHIYHEHVQNEHRDFYKSVIWAQYFLKPKLIDTSFKRKIINRFGKIGTKMIKIPKEAYGHTVVAIYEV